MITTVDEAIKRLEAAFWRRYNARPDLQDKLKGKTRILQLSFTDAPHESHWFHVLDGKLHEIKKEAHPKPDAVITTTIPVLLAIFNGEQKALAAYMTGKIKVKAGLSDMLFAKSLIGL